jgi:sensor domain CHASE-containing protein
MDRAEYEVHKMIEKVRAYQEAIEPFINAKVMALNCMLPAMTLHPDGHMESKYTPEQQAILDQYDEAIKSIMAGVDRMEE